MYRKVGKEQMQQQQRVGGKKKESKQKAWGVIEKKRKWRKCMV